MEGQQNLGMESSVEQHTISADEEVSEGENEAFKKSGMGGKKEERGLLLQGQGFWGMEEGGRSHT